MVVTSVTIGIPVSNLSQAQLWYEALLQKDRADFKPGQGVLEYQVGHVWLQLYEGVVKLNDWIFRIGVSDIQAERSRLLALGLSVGEIEEVPGVVAYCDFRDPDNNRLSLYTVLNDGS